MVVGRGYFSQDSLHSENVASAHRVPLGQPSLVKIPTSAISCLHFFQREALIITVKGTQDILCIIVDGMGILVGLRLFCQVL